MNHRILVVDDDREIIELVRRTLELEHYEVWDAADGLQALRTLQNSLPDLVLLDVNMPRMDGFAVCQRIRDLGLRLPVIMLTARTEVDSRVRGLDCGADDYMGKPFELPELVARVRAHLRRVEQARAVAQDLIRQKWEEINEGLMLAQAIQQPFRMRRQFDGVRTAVKYLPVGRIGGDFYNIMRMPNGETAFLIGDAVGKGLGASLLMASTFSLLTRLLDEESSPARIFESANASLKQDFAEMGIFVAAFLGIWRPARSIFTYCNAGHQSPVLLRHTSRRHALLSTDGFFLGAFEDGGYAEREIPLERGDRLWLFTDGLSDLRDPQGNIVDMRRIYRRMLRSWHLPVQEVVDRVVGSFSGLAEGGVTLRDDLTAMLIEIGDEGEDVATGVVAP